MKMHKKLVAVLLLCAGLIPGVYGEVDANAKIDGSVRATIIGKLKTARPDLEYTDVSHSPVAGIYQVQVVGGPILYVIGDGEYFFDGDLYKVKPGRFVNLREQAMVGMRKELLAGVDEKDMIVFAPVGPAKSFMYVFTDVDCGYCRKLHREVPELNQRGIEVRYLAFPRDGVGSPTYRKMVSAWCASNRKEALTELKNGGTLAAVECANPIAGQYQLGQRVGVTGTPAIVLADGSLLPGYQPAADLARVLGVDGSVAPGLN